jgi:polysaccharide transporter, PST family
MRSRRVLAENILALSLLQALNYAAPLITVPYLVRVLGPAQFGLLSFAQGIVLYFDFATDYGFNFSATRAISAARDRPEIVLRIFWSTISAKFVLMCASGLVLALLVAFTPKLRVEPSLFAVNFLYVVGTTFFPIWLFQGLERLKLAAAIFGIARLMTVPALFIFVRHSHDYIIAAAIQASVELAATIVAGPFLFSRLALKWSRPTISDITTSLKEGWAVFLSAATLFLSTSSTSVILGFTAGNVQVGYFSAADKLIRASIAVLNPLGQALYPHLTSVKLRSKELALQLIRKSFVVMGTLSLAASIATFFSARVLCNIALGPSFTPSVAVLKWLSPLPILFGLMNVLGTQTMLVFEMDDLLTRITLRSAAFVLPVTVVMSMLFGATGAAASSVALAASIVAAMLAALRMHGLSIWRNLFGTPVHLATVSSIDQV